MNAPRHFDPPSGSREALERTQAEKLRRLLGEILPSNELYRRKLGGSLPEWGRESSLESLLRALPLTTKAELLEDQARNPPFGTNLTYPLGSYTRIHQTSGTSGRALRWLDTPASWEWFVSGWSEVYRGAGILPSDRVFFPFSFGPFIGFWAAFESAVRLGSLAIPGGGMTTSARLRMIIEMGATVVAATPTYALHMAETARTQGIDLAASSVRALVVAGEPGGSIASTKARIEAAWGARCFDHCGMTEVGPFGFECVEGPGGMHAIESEIIVEVLDPATQKPAAPAGHAKKGIEGELVITSLGRTGSPVLRYRTGDIVRWSIEPCACGRSWGRFEGGILGRLDDMVFIRGNNLYPSAVEAILRGFADVAEYRVKVARRGELTGIEIEVEPAPHAAVDLKDRVAHAIEEALLFRAEVTLVPPGSLPRFELKGRRFVREAK